MFSPEKVYSFDLGTTREHDIKIFSQDGKNFFTLPAGIEPLDAPILSVHDWYKGTKFIGRRKQLRVLSNHGSPWVGYLDEKEVFHVVTAYQSQTQKAIDATKGHLVAQITDVSDDSFVIYDSELDENTGLNLNLYVSKIGKKSLYDNICGIAYPLYDQFIADGWVNELFHQGGNMSFDAAAGTMTGYPLWANNTISLFGFISERIYMTALNYAVEEFVYSRPKFAPYILLLLYSGSMILFHWITRIAMDEKLPVHTHKAIHDLIKALMKFTGGSFCRVPKYLELRYLQLKTKNNMDAYVKAQVGSVRKNAWDVLLNIAGEQSASATDVCPTLPALLALYQDVIMVEGKRGFFSDETVLINHLDFLKESLILGEPESARLWKLLILGKAGLFNQKTFIKLAWKEAYFFQMNRRGSFASQNAIALLNMLIGTENTRRVISRVRKTLIAPVVSTVVIDQSTIVAREEERKRIIEKQQRENSLGDCILCNKDVQSTDEKYYVVSCRCHLTERTPLHKKCHPSFSMECSREKGEIVYIAEFSSTHGKKILLDKRKSHSAAAAPQ
ncbi:MAG: hypothetical protein Hyperionvirus6_78 [Hyperionvirus sp.]|uniref:Uncharacterized protein n=1 Tax=Hyperionvirus sp. TaxID=2487770 RepID=A0A3G5A807_9VIRU|nr:MAG: hypothetical protein Hyperionvirus6_78 [Hyperionvirus sp.]